jgi:predicted DNA-binding transcriptional regulator AlpA
VLNSSEAAMFVGLSLPHFRRLYRAGRVPRPLQLGERKLGWRIGDLIDHVAAKAAA